MADSITPPPFEQVFVLLFTKNAKICESATKRYKCLNIAKKHKKNHKMAEKSINCRFCGCVHRKMTPNNFFGKRKKIDF